MLIHCISCLGFKYNFWSSNLNHISSHIRHLKDREREREREREYHCMPKWTSSIDGQVQSQAILFLGQQLHLLSIASLSSTLASHSACSEKERSERRYSQSPIESILIFKIWITSMQPHQISSNKFKNRENMCLDQFNVNYLVSIMWQRIL